MSVRRVMGTETEYGIAVPGQPGANAMVTSSQVVNAYQAARSARAVPTGGGGRGAGVAVAHSQLPGAGRGAQTRKRRGPDGAAPLRVPVYRYWPVLLTVSIARPDSAPLPPETSVRM